jgi:hypothetical protein
MALTEQAAVMQWPPVVAQAEVSGAGALAFIEALGRPLGLTVLGPNDDRWLIRATDRDVLLDELEQVERGEERLRIALH